MNNVNKSKHHRLNADMEKDLKRIDYDFNHYKYFFMLFTDLEGKPSRKILE